MSTKKDVDPLKVSGVVGDDELFELDLESSNLSMAAAVVEFKKLGRVKIADIIQHESGDEFYADITGIPGIYEFKVQGADSLYSLGADTVVTLLLAIDQERPVMTKDVVIKMRSTHKVFYQKLRTARRKK